MPELRVKIDLPEIIANRGNISTKAKTAKVSKCTSFEK